MSAAASSKERGGNTEKLLIAALAVVIVGTVACTIYFAFLRDKNPKGGFHTYCLNCNKSMVLNAKQIPMEPSPSPSDANTAAGAGPQRMVCPECKSGTLIMERCCQKCGQYFADQWDKEHPLGLANPMDTRPEIKCLHCGEIQNVPAMPVGPAETGEPTPGP